MTMPVAKARKEAAMKLIVCCTVTIALVVGLALAAGAASAPTYPTKPIRLIVPYPPGAGTDLICRIISQELSKARARRW